MTRPAAGLPARFAALLSVFLAAGCDAKPPATTAAAGPQPQSLPTVSMTLGGKPFTLQVADTEDKRATGLMYTRSMPDDRGMIFVFPGERTLAFWMQNTPIDLDIVYVDHAGSIVSIKTMRAYDENTVPSDEPAMYAIELNAGAAAKLGLKAGQRLDVPAGLATSAR